MTDIQQPVDGISGEIVETTIVARCLCYAAFSELLASPHDIDPRIAARGRMGIGAALAYASGLDGHLGAIAAAELDALRLDYSGLFEVGSEGPPVPIREDLQTGQRNGTREDIVRFYDYFGYVLDEKFAWQPDHLSIELEFMHYLAFRETANAADALSFQLAQVDFCERHLGNWLPGLAKRVLEVAPRSLYAGIVTSLADFVSADLDWQRQTVRGSGSERTCSRSAASAERAG